MAKQSSDQPLLCKWASLAKRADRTKQGVASLRTNQILNPELSPCCNRAEDSSRSNGAQAPSAPTLSKTEFLNLMSALLDVVFTLTLVEPFGVRESPIDQLVLMATVPVEAA